jgi:hypothetical protein
MIRFDLLAYLVIIADLAIAAFLIWRATAKKATLWGAARIVYWYVALLSLYHAGIYIYTIFFPNSVEAQIVYQYIHPFVILYLVNPLLIAIIHYKGGHIL